MGRIESELVGLPGKALTQDATRRLRFIVHAAGRLHSMVLHGRLCCCCTARHLNASAVVCTYTHSVEGMECVLHQRITDLTVSVMQPSSTVSHPQTISGTSITSMPQNSTCRLCHLMSNHPANNVLPAHPHPHVTYAEHSNAGSYWKCFLW